MALRFFCPQCWNEIPATARDCARCGADLRAMDAEAYPLKLVRALCHPDAQTAVRAAWILGERRERSAVPELIRVLEITGDSFLAEAAAEALGKIGDKEALPVLARAQEGGTLRVGRAASLAINRISARASLAVHKSGEK